MTPRAQPLPPPVQTPQSFGHLHQKGPLCQLCTGEEPGSQPLRGLNLDYGTAQDKSTPGAAGLPLHHTQARPSMLCLFETNALLLL